MSEPKFKALEKSTAELISACQRGIEAARNMTNLNKEFKIVPIRKSKSIEWWRIQ